MRWKDQIHLQRKKQALWPNSTLYITKCVPGSVVVIATAYGLDGPGIESRWG